LNTDEERRWYTAKAIEHNWSRNVLAIQIELNARGRSSQAVTNFEQRLPKPDSDLARESLKDPCRFDFLGLTEEAQARAVEAALVQHVSARRLPLPGLYGVTAHA
jgi:predicted nuclease of restriction endonuclease-like (RecB) superfamily